MMGARKTVQETAALALGGILAAAVAAAFAFNDGALATIRVALNLSGLGVLSFNPAEHVLTFDHPLWALWEAAAATFFRNYPAAIEATACGCAGLAAWLALRRAEQIKAFFLAVLLLGLPVFISGLSDGGDGALVALLLAALAAEASRKRGGLAPTAFLTSLLFLARFPAAALALPLLLHRALTHPRRRDFGNAALALLPAAAWLAGGALYFGGVRMHSLHGDLSLPNLGPLLRIRGIEALRFAAQQPLAAAFLGIALIKVAPALWRGAVLDAGDWLGLGLAIGIGQSFLAGAAGWEPASIAILLWLAFLTLCGDRRWSAGTLVLVAAATVLSFGGFDVRHWPAKPANPPAAPAWPTRQDWISRRPGPDAPRVLILDPTPGRTGLERGPAAYVIDGAALGDSFWSAANRAAKASIAGTHPALAGSPGRFAPVAHRSALDHAITLVLRLRPRPPGTLEPIVAAGDARGGDLYSIRYLENRRIYFAVTKYESDLTLLSRTISDVDFSRPHRLTVQYGRESRPSPTAENLVIWDGRLVKEIAAPLRVRRFAPQEIVVGWNTVGNRECGPWFSGDILAAASATPRELTDFTRTDFPLADRSVLLRIQPAADEPAGQPLIVTGREFAGDSYSLWKVDSGHVRIGHDHWGDRAIEWGPNVPFDFSRPHDIDILVLNRGFAGRLTAPLAVVRIDRRVALVSRKALNPYLPDQVYALENPLQMSSCGQYFEGRIISAASRPPPPEDIGGITGQWSYLEGCTGALALTAYFDPDAPLGAGQALVETGRTGRGDILYLVRDGAASFHFGFDHWGVGGRVGAPFTLDPTVPHRVGIEMPSLAAPTTEAGLGPRTIRVSVDDKVVFAAQSACYEPGPGEFYLAGNRLGASTTRMAFAGLIVSAERF